MLEDYPLLQKWLREWNCKSIAWTSFKSDFEKLKQIIGEKLGKQSTLQPVEPLEVYRLPTDINPREPDAEDLLLFENDSKAQNKKPAPYLGLRYFRRKDAQLFFGRTPEILEFISLIKNPKIRIIRLYGHSGVGKSSFLSAGVLPRLELFCQPYYVRRNKIVGLDRQLQVLMGEFRDADKPPVYLLDQAEEMFVDPLPSEMNALLTTITNALRVNPTITFVFGFRSDYLLDMYDLLAKIHEEQADLPLRPLTHLALMEAIEGVWLNPKLRQSYCLQLELGFAAHVASDLLRTESGGVTSILQNRLLKLYETAYARRTPDAPDANLSINDYQSLKTKFHCRGGTA